MFAGPPEDLDITAFRDPQVRREDGRWKALLGAGVPGAGGAGLTVPARLRLQQQPRVRVGGRPFAPLQLIVDVDQGQDSRESHQMLPAVKPVNVGPLTQAVRHGGRAAFVQALREAER